MNPKLESLFFRRSIRRYAPNRKPVPESLIQDLLEAGMAAPSARDTQPWRVVVVRDETLLTAMGECLPNGKAMLEQVPVALVICGELESACDGLESYMVQDCSALIENILLGASMLGLGTCWIGIHPRTERMMPLKSLLTLPDGIIPVGGIVIGWPEESKEARTRFNPEFVHENTW